MGGVTNLKIMNHNAGLTWSEPVEVEHDIALLHGKSVVELFVELQQNVVLANLQTLQEQMAFIAFKGMLL